MSEGIEVDTRISIEHKKARFVPDAEGANLSGRKDKAWRVHGKGVERLPLGKHAEVNQIMRFGERSVGFAIRADEYWHAGGA